MATRFERDTAVTRLDDSVYEARMDSGWWISRGPNGGYVAATMLRALTSRVDDPERAVRSLTVHFTAPPTEGTVRIETGLERQGRSMTTCTARLWQESRLCGLAIAAFSRPRVGPELQEAPMPRIPAAEHSAPRAPSDTPMRARYDSRPAVLPGAGSSDGPARTGGWIRLREPQPVDACALTAMADAWPPALMDRRWPGGARPPAGFPTVDLSVHFRSALPRPGIADDAHWLVQFSTRVVRDGFLEEDGDLWSPDGTLVAHSRQLGVLL